MRKLNWLVPAAAVVVVAAGVAAYLVSIRDAWRPPKVVLIESDKTASALLPSNIYWYPAPEDDGKQALLLREGDYIWSNGIDLPVRYLASDGSALQLASDDWSLALNGNVVALSFSAPDALAWLAAASDEQLARLRTIKVPEDAGPELLAALRQVAEINPHLDFDVDSADVLRSLLVDFRPRAVFIGRYGGDQLVTLSGQPELDTLVIDASQPGSLDYLPKLPKLRRLVLGTWDPEKAGPLPAGLHSLKSLILSEGELTDFSALQAAPVGLEELALWLEVGSGNFEFIESLDNLRVLFFPPFDEDSAPPLPDLTGLRRLRWIGLPKRLTQDQLGAVVKSRPEIEILELAETEKPLDLVPLRELKNLYGLVLGGTYENLDVVLTLKSLRFLGISEESWPESPEKVAEIRAALPDAVVIRIDPFCLGSGWLLLLLPLLGSAWQRHETRHRPARAA